MKSIPYSIWLISCAHAVTDLSAGALFVALPYFKVKLGLSYAELAAIVLLQNLTSSVSQPVFGYLSDHKSRPWWMALGCFINGTVMLTSLLVPTYALVLLCTAISGFGNALFHPEGAKTVNWLSGTAKGTGASLFSVGGNIGFALGSLFLGTLLWENSNALYLFALPSVIMSILLLSATKQFVRAPHPKQGDRVKTGAAFNMNFPLLALLGVVLVRATVTSGISTFVPLYYTSYLHGSASYAASLLTVFLAAGAIGTLLGGTLSDRYGSKRVMLYSILPVAVLLYFFKIVGGIWTFVLLACVSVLLASTFTSSLVMAQKMMPRNIGMASGLTLGFSMGLGAMGVFALGQVADVSGMPWVFNLLTVLPLFGFLFTLAVREPKAISTQQSISENCNETT